MTSRRRYRPFSLRPRRRWLLVLPGALGAVLLGGTASAYWLNVGTGTGSASSATGLTSLTTTATVASGAALAPGGAAVALSVQVDNPGSLAVTVTAVALDNSRTIGVSGAKGTCVNPPLTVTTPVGWSGLTVPAGGSTGATTIPGAVALGVGASSGCQGATFTIPVTLTGHN
jgi:hypothetical protein